MFKQRDMLAFLLNIMTFSSVMIRGETSTSNNFFFSFLNGVLVIPVQCDEKIMGEIREIFTNDWLISWISLVWIILLICQICFIQKHTTFLHFYIRLKFGVSDKSFSFQNNKLHRFETIIWIKNQVNFNFWNIGSA